MTTTPPDDPRVEAVAARELAALGSDKVDIPDSWRRLYLDHARAALTALDRAAWRPIETAPENIAVLVWVNGPDFLGMEISTKDYRYGKDYPWTDDTGGGDKGDRYTHWRPLPEGPAIEETPA